MNVRSTLERMSRGIVIKKRLGAEFGRLGMYVTPDASLRYWKPGLSATDPWLFQIVRELVVPGMQVWDIGAIVGLFGLPCAHRTGPEGGVLMVEAVPLLASLCQRSAHGAGGLGLNVDLVCAAVSATRQWSRFVVAERGRASYHLAALGSSQSGGQRMMVSTVFVTLDWLLEHCPYPNLVKIDVEGAEHDVLCGSSRLLSRVCPVFVIEVCASRRADVTAVLKRHDYILQDAELPASKRQPLDQCSFNTLAVPN
jgi:FkbM family methyltransferase